MSQRDNYRLKPTKWRNLTIIKYHLWIDGLYNYSTLMKNLYRLCKTDWYKLAKLLNDSSAHFQYPVRCLSFTKSLYDNIQNTIREAFTKKIGESWDIVPTGREGTLSIHISVPTEKIPCSEQLRTYNKEIKYFWFSDMPPNIGREGRDPEELGQCPNFHQFFFKAVLAAGRGLNISHKLLRLIMN